MRIVFHGENAAAFSHGFADLVGGAAEVTVLPDRLKTEADREAFIRADVIVGVRFDASLPHPERLRLFHVPGAGTDAVDFAALPPRAMVCNCFGHEQAIAEYVMAALLQRHVPLVDADRSLRGGEWRYWAGAPERAHSEIAGTTIGLLGFGHIGKAVAKRARAFEMQVHVANRSPVDASQPVDRFFPLSDIMTFWGSVDAIIVTVPLTPETCGFVGPEAFATMRPHAVLVNVARGPVVDERALYDALREERIGGAVIDTWYRYPGPSDPRGEPSALPFHELPNVLMTPHMSGWTTGTIARRQLTMARNARQRLLNQPCENVVRDA